MDKTSSSPANKMTSDPASSFSSKSSPESRTSLESKTAEKENEFQYTTRGDFKSQRNELQPPHLRSSYPVEQEVIFLEIILYSGYFQSGTLLNSSEKNKKFREHAHRKQKERLIKTKRPIL